MRFGSNETVAAGSRLRCGAARLLSNERGEEVRFTGLRDLSCLSSTIRLLLVQWKVNGRDFRPSSVGSSSYR